MTIFTQQFRFGNYITGKTALKECSIFIVDDSPYDLQLMRRYLNLFPDKTLDNTKQLIIEGFSSAGECLREMYRKPDIVILDYYLDVTNQISINGLDLMQEIHEKSPNTKVIIVSGQSNSDVTSKLIKYGAFSYVAKDQYYEKQLRGVITDILQVDQVSPNWNEIKIKRWSYNIYGIILYTILIYFIIRICS